MDSTQPIDFQKLRPSGLLVCAGGFEERSTTFAARLGERVSNFEAALLIKYSGDDDDNSRNHERVREALLHCPKLVVVELDRTRPVQSAQDLVKQIESLWRTAVPSDAWVDVSGLTSIWIAAALETLTRLGARTTLVYTEATDYYPTEEEAAGLLKDLAEGEPAGHDELADVVLSSTALGGIHLLPGLGGSHRPDKRTCLIAFVGYEPHRIRGLVDQYAPSAIVALMGISPHSNLRWRRELSMKLHHGIFAKWPVRQADTSTLDVNAIVNMLEEHYRVLRHEYDLAVSPQCSKMQVVAAFLFWRRHPDIQLVFTTPGAYIRPAQGAGRSFMFGIPALAHGN